MRPQATGQNQNRLRTILEGLCADSVPFAPFLGGNAARVMGISERDMYSDANRLAMSTLSALDVYEIDGVSIGFDLSVEAEQVGVQTEWSEEFFPGSGRPVGSDYRPGRSRLAVVRDAIGHVARKVGAEVCVTAVIVGPHTLVESILSTRGAGFSRSSAIDSAMAAIQESTKAYGEGACLLAVIDPRLSELTESEFGDGLASAYKRISSLASYYGMKAALYPGTVRAPQDIERYASCGLSALLLSAKGSEPDRLPEVVPALGVCVSPALFDEDPGEITRFARNLRAMWSARPAFLSTLGELPYSCSPAAVRRFITVLQ